MRVEGTAVDSCYITDLSHGYFIGTCRFETGYHRAADPVFSMSCSFIVYHFSPKPTHFKNVYVIQQLTQHC